jgi:3-oxoacyl-[acyl-carrier-protein] synthase II
MAERAVALPPMDFVPPTERPEHRRVVVTGLGGITPLAPTILETVARLNRGEIGLSTATFDYTGATVFGLINDFDPAERLKKQASPKDLRRMLRPHTLAIAGAVEALEDAQMLGSGGKLKRTVDSSRTSLRVGTGVGGMTNLTRLTEKLINGKSIFPSEIVPTFPEEIGGDLARMLGIRGALSTTSTACASGPHALSVGMQDIIMGTADVVIVVGVEGAINPVAIKMFENIRALSMSNDPKTASQPLSRNREGFVFSEGTAVLVLESFEHALQRGIEEKIYAELTGWGDFTDGSHPTNPTGKGIYRAMDLALRRAGPTSSPEDKVHVSLHATATGAGDPPEVQAVKRILGDRAYEATYEADKRELGHSLGAAGAIETAIAILGLASGVVSPTLLEKPMAAARGLHIPQEPEKRDHKRVIKNASGFGGHNLSLVIDRPSDRPKEWVRRGTFFIYPRGKTA